MSYKHFIQQIINNLSTQKIIYNKNKSVEHKQNTDKHQRDIMSIIYAINMMIFNRSCGQYITSITIFQSQSVH